MTQLERELKEALKIQEEIFKKEIQSVSESYEKTLNDISTAYTEQMSKVLEVIERQSQALSKYEGIAKNIQISIDEKQLQQLKTSHTNLTNRLEELESQDKDLVKQLNAVLQKL